MLIRASLLALVLGAAPGLGLDLGLGVDLDGHPVKDLVSQGGQAVVLFFAASDCPISNRYVPEMQRLAEQFAPLGVGVWFVYPNPADDARVVRAHNVEYSIHTKTVLDNSQTLTRMAHATSTPEVAVFVPYGATLHEVYRGRIDDRYLAPGSERPQPTHHDLEEAVRAVLAHQPVPPPGGPPVGCSIVTRQP